MQGIADRVAIITGGASGIGAGLVRAFVAAGAKVAFADIQDEPAHALAAELDARCAFVHTDLRHDPDIDRLVATTAERFGGIDFIINAAATYADQGIASDRAAWQNGFDTNLIGHVMLVRRALDRLRRSSWPSVVWFSSESAHVGLTGRWIYPATKAAIEQVVRSQALDLAPDRIRVNAVMPGWTEKPWHRTAPPDVKDHYAKMSGRLHMIRPAWGRWKKSPTRFCSCARSTPPSSPEPASRSTAATARSARRARTSIRRPKRAQPPASGFRRE